MSGFRGHRPSGSAAWPMVLVAGAEKTGKSYLVAEFSGSDLIGNTFWIEYGETTAEQYGDVPGARYVVADHDGTIDDVCRRAREAVAEPMVDGKPNCIVIDSVTLIWDTLSAEAQLIANRRKKADVDAESKITSDIWNLVTERWKKLLRILRSHNGPVVLVARLEVVAVMDSNGQPTKDKTQKVKAQKNLPYDVDVIVQIPAYRRFQLTGVRSLKLQMPPGETFDVPDDFTLDGLMRNLGLPNDVPMGPRVYTEPVPDAEAALGDAGRPAQHSRGPVEDEWNTATGQPLTPPAPGVPSATAEQISELIKLIGIKRRVFNGQCARVVSELVRRRVDDPRMLSQAEARSAIEMLTAEPDAAVPETAEPGPAPVGSPNNPPHTDAQMRMIQAMFKERNVTDPQAKRDIIGRILGAPIESAKELSKDQASKVIESLRTGEVPPAAPEPPGPNATGEGISEFDVLDQMIRDVDSDEAVMAAEHAIALELSRGAITASDSELLLERLTEHVSNAKAAAA